MSPEETERIREDETLRHEVRTQLRSRGSLAWSYLNSGFVLLILSTVVFGGMAFLFKGYLTRLEKRQAAEHHAQVIRSELTQRLSAYRSKIEGYRNTLQGYQNALLTKTPPKPTQVYHTLRQMYQETDRPPTSYEPELAAYGIQRLLEDLGPALAESGKTTKSLSGRIKKSQVEWQEIFVMCSREYDRFRTENLNPTGYFNRMAEICDTTKEHLNHGALGQWIDEPPEND